MAFTRPTGAARTQPHLGLAEEMERSLHTKDTKISAWPTPPVAAGFCLVQHLSCQRRSNQPNHTSCRHLASLSALPVMPRPAAIPVQRLRVSRQGTFADLTTCLVATAATSINKTIPCPPTLWRRATSEAGHSQRRERIKTHQGVAGDGAHARSQPVSLKKWLPPASKAVCEHTNPKRSTTEDSGRVASGRASTISKRKKPDCPCPHKTATSSVRREDTGQHVTP